MDRNDRINVFLDTVKCANNGYYKNFYGNDIKIPLEERGISIESPTYYKDDTNGLIDFKSLPKYDTIIEVVNNDCLYAAKDLIKEGYSPVVVNNASFKRPGGGVLSGSAAQEENICRRTNLFMSIFRFDKALAKEFGLNVEKDQYPLPMRYGAIYSPFITVFKNSEDKDYLPLNKPYIVDVITIAAIKNPPVTKDFKLYDESKDIIKCKIRTMLNLGIINHNDAIVLGAFGCGAYSNPPSEVAKLFKEVLEEENYVGKYRKIVFAILDDGNSHRPHNPKGNFIPFVEMFNR